MRKWLRWGEAAHSGLGGAMQARGDDYTAFLEEQVCRLNVELARFQRSEGSNASLSLAVETSGIERDGTEVPEFLLDNKRLPPLIHAYDTQVRCAASEQRCALAGLCALWHPLHRQWYPSNVIILGCPTTNNIESESSS